jgi:hypothetical protein
VASTLTREASVPVTVKFSEQFYRRLGHEAVDEMVNWFNQVDATYRGDLRELNEHNFARFDAKLEQRAAQLDAKIEQRVAELKTEIHAQGRALIQWMFAFWVAQAGLTVGLVLLVARR